MGIVYLVNLSIFFDLTILNDQETAIILESRDIDEDDLWMYENIRFVRGNATDPKSIATSDIEEYVSVASLDRYFEKK